MNALYVASRFAGARVLAIDLSLSSLAYALRKTRQLGVTNVEYGQADILKLRDLGRQFDLIDCVGRCCIISRFLWPAGGRSSTSLRSGSVMRIGLYSELGRRGAVVRARAMIADKGYAPTPAHIPRLSCRRSWRWTWAPSPRWQPCPRRFAHDERVPRSASSMSKSVATHPAPDRRRFARVGLVFLGFELSNAESQRSFRRRHPEPPALSSLALWHRFEQENPRTFSAMYQFLVPQTLTLRPRVRDAL